MHGAAGPSSSSTCVSAGLGSDTPKFEGSIELRNLASSRVLGGGCGLDDSDDRRVAQGPRQEPVRRAHEGMLLWLTTILAALWKDLKHCHLDDDLKTLPDLRRSNLARCRSLLKIWASSRRTWWRCGRTSRRPAWRCCSSHGAPAAPTPTCRTTTTRTASCTRVRK